MKNPKISHSSQLCDVVKYTREGRESGRYLDVYNGNLNFTVCLDKCMDISYFRHQGENISFISPNGICADGSFERTFCGGMLYTCGLESLGKRRGFPVHGSIHRVKASLKQIACNEREILIEGEMRDAGLFGGNVSLRRSIHSEYQSGSVEITDVLTNDGFTDAEYALLYHMNLGYPFLDDGVKVCLQAAQSRGRNDFASRNLPFYSLVGSPVDLQEQVFFHDASCGRVEVVNNLKGKAVEFLYNQDNLPCLVQWKSMVAGNYALGIEPSTSFLDGDFRYKTLKVGESKTFTVSITVKNI